MDSSVIDQYMSSIMKTRPNQEGTRDKRASIAQTGESLKNHFIIPKSSALGDIWANSNQINLNSGNHEH